MKIVPITSKECGSPRYVLSTHLIIMSLLDFILFFILGQNIVCKAILNSRQSSPTHQLQSLCVSFRVDRHVSALIILQRYLAN